MSRTRCVAIRGPGRRHRGAVAALALLATGVLGADASGDPAAEALTLAAEGRCAAAVPRLEALAAGPAAEDPRVHRALGLCRLRANRFAEAAAALERSLALDPRSDESALQLAAARYHLEDREGARAALERVGPEGRERAEWWLYRGLLALEASRPSPALEALDRARRLDADAVDPVASFYAGAAASSLGRAATAREAFERVRTVWPGTPWAEEARRALEGLERERLRFASLEAGFEYDDNAVLRGEGVALPEEIGQESDVRGVWRLEVGGELLRTEATALGAAFRYGGTAHRELDAFDTHYPSALLWLDRELGADLLLRAQLSAGYAWVDGEPFLADQRARLGLHRAGGLGVTTLFAEVYREEVFYGLDDVPDGPGTPGAPCPGGALVCGPLGLDEAEARDRDGTGYALGLEQRAALPGLEGGSLFGGYRFHAFRADGLEYTYDAHELRAGATVPLPAAFVAELDVAFAWRPYRHPTTFPDPESLVAGRAYALEGSDRRERELRTSLAVERPLTDVLRVGAAWRYTRNHSNADVFDYARHVVGAYVTVEFGG